MSDNSSRTYQTRIKDELDAPLVAYADLMAHVEHSLFREVSAGKISGDLKSSYLTSFHITARQFNATRVRLPDALFPQFGKYQHIHKLRIIALCEKTKKPLILENLDFKKKKAQLKEKNHTYSRMLSGFAYASIIAQLRSRGQAKGIEVHAVNPAYTSLIGRVNFAKRYGLTIHLAAALCIGRRFLGVSEKMPQGQRDIPDGKGGHVTLDLPVRNRSRHVWSQWGQLNRQLSAALTAHFRAVPTDPGVPKSDSCDSDAQRILSAELRHANRQHDCSVGVSDLSM